MVSPNFRAIGPVFKADGNKAAEFIASLKPDVLIQQAEEGRLEFEGNKITPEMFKISEELPEGFMMTEIPQGRLYLDIRITPDLEAEAYSREIIRRIQEMRKEYNLNVDDRIATTLSFPKELAEKIAGWEKHIASETRSVRFEIQEPSGYVKEWNIENYPVKIGIERMEKSSKGG